MHNVNLVREGNHDGFLKRHLNELYWRAIAQPRILKLVREAVGNQQMSGYETFTLVRFLLRAAPRQAVEIGSFCGVTSKVLAWHLREYVPGAQLFCIDPFETEKEHTAYYRERFTEKHLGFDFEEMFDKNVKDFSDVVVKIKGYSDTAELPETLSPDFLFIDGDHSFEGVKHDILRYVPMVNVGGYICFHDFAPGRSGVLRALLETIWPAPNNLYYQLRAHENSLLVLQKVAETPPQGFVDPI
jgi:predicted O-methyltransferase YrrM